MPVAILMPALSPTMTEGNVSKWLKKVGDNIKSGDIIAEVETDKATMEVEAIDEGVLAKIIHDDGAENIAVNSLIGVISIDNDTKEDVDAFLKSNNEEIKEGNKPEINEIVDPKNNPDVEVLDSNKEIFTNEGDSKFEETEQLNIDKSNPSLQDNRTKETNNLETRVSISPLAKRIVSLNNIDINKVSGTGPRGRIIKRDLEIYLQKVNKQDANGIDKQERKELQSSNKIALTNIKKTIATRLQQSKQNVPHFYLKTKVSADEIIKMRKVINSIKDNENNSNKISYNDIIIKSVASALKIVPEMNRIWNDDHF